MLVRKILFYVLIFTFFFSVLIYGIYKAVPIILGPEVEYSISKEAQIPNENDSTTVRGNVKRVQELFVNKVPTAFSETGSFETRVPLYPGSNLIHIEVFDKFGRKAESYGHVDGNEQVSSPN
jgi:hypothetical protein